MSSKDFEPITSAYGINSPSLTISSAYSEYCGMGQHVRVSAGLFMPDTCHCGAIRYARHTCSCGNIHEQAIPTGRQGYVNS